MALFPASEVVADRKTSPCVLRRVSHASYPQLAGGLQGRTSMVPFRDRACGESMRRAVDRCWGFKCSYFEANTGLHGERSRELERKPDGTYVMTVQTSRLVFSCRMDGGIGGSMLPARAKQFEARDVPETCPFLTEYAVSQ